MSPVLSNLFFPWLMHSFADGIGVAVITLILAEIPIALTRSDNEDRQQALQRAARFILAALVSIAVPVTLAELGKEFQVWPGHPGFPSGHTTFTASASAAIAVYRGKGWWVLGAPLTLLMMISLVYLKLHGISEVIGGMVLGIGLGTLIMRMLFRPRVSEPSHVTVEE